MPDESKYPLTYEEYEKRVVELFLKEYDGDKLEVMTERINKELAHEPSIIKRFYVDDCFTYDSPQIYGNNCKRTFEDSYLSSGVVRQLRMILEG